MQPYFLPYIGYWQLINIVDIFVVYDNIQYTKKGWINRNRFLQNGKDSLISIPLKKGSDYLNINERNISSNFNKKKLLLQLKNAYLKAPQRNEILPLLEEIIMFEDDNLFNYILNSITKICSYLKINTKIIVSSTIEINHALKAQDKVLALCNALGTNHYINAIGGQELYNKKAFSESHINLQFIKTNEHEYKQYENEFVSSLSIIDILFFNDKNQIKQILNSYTLI